MVSPSGARQMASWVSLLLLTMKPGTQGLPFTVFPTTHVSTAASGAQLLSCIYPKAHLHSLDHVPSTLHLFLPSQTLKPIFAPPLLCPQPTPVSSRIASGDNVL